jgi:hypothetical protein
VKFKDSLGEETPADAVIRLKRTAQHIKKNRTKTPKAACKQIPNLIEQHRYPEGGSNRYRTIFAKGIIEYVEKRLTRIKRLNLDRGRSEPEKVIRSLSLCLSLSLKLLCICKNRSCLSQS